jgi:catechol 2,3-dioxygenase
VTAPADPSATGLFHTAFRFPTRAALGDALARVAAARLGLGAGDHLVSEALYVDDPDGNGVELYWDRPGEQWPGPSRDALVPMATLPVDLDGLHREGRGPEAVGDAAPAGTDIGHVHLQVSCIDQTIAFYRDVLDLDLTARMGSSAGFFSSNGYHHNIGANTWRSRGAKREGKERAGLERVVFGVANTTEMEALRTRLSAGGHRWTGDGEDLAVLDPDEIELRFSLAA